MANGSELNAVEKKQPQAVATFITNITEMAVIKNAKNVGRKPATK